jgi:hypothetical protein
MAVLPEAIVCVAIASKRLLNVKAEESAAKNTSDAIRAFGAKEKVTLVEKEGWL